MNNFSSQKRALHKKWSFPLRISSLNVTKDFVTFTEEILNGNFIFCAVISIAFSVIKGIDKFKWFDLDYIFHRRDKKLKH